MIVHQYSIASNFPQFIYLMFCRIQNATEKEMNEIMVMTHD